MALRVLKAATQPHKHLVCVWYNTCAAACCCSAHVKSFRHHCGGGYAQKAPEACQGVPARVCVRTPSSACVQLWLSVQPYAAECYLMLGRVVRGFIVWPVAVH
jgi:hypothetical protein